MKFRIKEIVKTFEDDHQEKEYRIQFKFLFWWKDLWCKMVKSIENNKVNLKWKDGEYIYTYEIKTILCTNNIITIKTLLNFLNDESNKDIDIAIWNGAPIYYYKEDYFASLNADDVKEHIKKEKVKNIEINYYID